MSTACYELPANETVFSGASPIHEVELVGGVEKNIPIASVYQGPSLSANSTSTMGAVPVTLADFLVEKFSALANVRALMVGESDDVHHVWVLIDEWTAAQRKSVYAIQREILQQVAGFNFDFYVIDIPSETRPEEMVSGIPILYEKQ